MHRLLHHTIIRLAGGSKLRTWQVIIMRFIATVAIHASVEVRITTI